MQQCHFNFFKINIISFFLIIIIIIIFSLKLLGVNITWTHFHEIYPISVWVCHSLQCSVLVMVVLCHVPFDLLWGFKWVWQFKFRNLMYIISFSWLNSNQSTHCFELSWLASLLQSKLIYCRMQFNTHNMQFKDSWSQMIHYSFISVIRGFISFDHTTVHA